MSMKSFRIIREPVNTEKARRSWGENSRGRTYTFVVDAGADKAAIKKAVEEAFLVKVSAVRTLTRKGKFRRRRIQGGWRSDTKRAFVTLAPDQKISFFDGI